MRAWIYDRAVRPLTTRWYRAVLERLPPGTHLLDVGVGTGGALVGNAGLIRSRDLRVTGLDIDADYIRACRARLDEHGLADRVEARLESVYDHDGGPYGAAYFSASFMLLPDPVAALRHVLELQPGPDRRVFFTQTIQEKRSVIVEKTKPWLKLLTTIDFGQVTYEEDFRAAINAAGCQVVTWEALGGGRGLRYRLAEVTPTDA